MTAGRTDVLSGIKLTYTGGDLCETTQVPTKFSLNMYCDDTMELTDFDYSLGLQGNICEPYLDTVSKAACSNLDISEIWEYIQQYDDYFGVFMLVAGLLLTFMGLKLLKPAICFAGFLTTILVSCFIFYAVYLEKESQLADFWYFLGGGAFAGIFVGLLVAWAYKVGAAVLAGWGGVCGGLVLYEAILFRAEVEWLFWVTVVVCAIGAAAVTFWFLDEAVIISSVLLGSYSIIRGVACYAGHYYNEVTMAKMAADGLLDEIDHWFWAYVGGYFVLVALGMYI